MNSKTRVYINYTFFTLAVLTPFAPAQAGQLFPPYGQDPTTTCPIGQVLTWVGDVTGNGGKDPGVICSSANLTTTGTAIATPTSGVAATTTTCPAGTNMIGIQGGAPICSPGWQPVYENNSDGAAVFGSLSALQSAVTNGAEVRLVVINESSDEARTGYSCEAARFSTINNADVAECLMQGMGTLDSNIGDGKTNVGGVGVIRSDGTVSWVVIENWTTLTDSKGVSYNNLDLSQSPTHVKMSSTKYAEWFVHY